MDYSINPNFVSTYKIRVVGWLRENFFSVNEVAHISHVVPAHLAFGYSVFIDLSGKRITRCIPGGISFFYYYYYYYYIAV